MLFSVGRANSTEEGETNIRAVLDNGKAMQKWHSMLLRQGVSREVAEKLCSEKPNFEELLPTAKHRTELKCSQSGTIPCYVVGSGWGIWESKFRPLLPNLLFPGNQDNHFKKNIYNPRF